LSEESVRRAISEDECLPTLLSAAPDYGWMHLGRSESLAN